MVIKVLHSFREFFCDIITFVFSKFRLSLPYFLVLFITVTIIFFYPILHNPSSTIHHFQPLIQSILAYNLTNKFENSLPTKLYLKIDNSTNNLANPSKIENDVKRILLWTPFFGVKDYGFGIGRDAFIKAKCPFNNCMTTSDRNLVNQSDAVVFHPFDFNVKDLPTHRKAHQRYILFFYEAYVSHRNFPVFQNPTTNFEFFNWTMTYRRDSDIYGSSYGIITRRNESAQLNAFPLLLSQGESPPDSSSFWEFSGVNQSRQHPAVANRTNLVAWFVTNCNTPSKREIFFYQVAQYIQIDIFGVCGPLKCPHGGSKKCDKLLDHYKFYVSAENSICPDYITEKFYRALEMGVVPVVYGGADYSAYAPPHSYINAADFVSPQALADYLLLIERNPRLYSEYLDWNNKWEIKKQTKQSGEYWCCLCEKLNAAKSEEMQKNNSSKVYPDIAKWYYDTVSCLPGSTIMKKYGIY
jgi:alpha-1,3-fucosyltransferase